MGRDRLQVDSIQNIEGSGKVFLLNYWMFCMQMLRRGAIAMKLKQSLQILLVVVAAITLLILSPVPVWAADNQSNQVTNQSAMLVAPEPDFKINIYAQPDTRLPRIGYGLGGDRITVLEQVGSNEGYTWHRVRFDAGEDAEGWVRGDFVAFDNPAQSNGMRQWGKSRQGDRYFGRQPQSMQKNSDSGQTQNNYQQQQNYQNR
jgi:hypothetical protein